MQTVFTLSHLGLLLGQVYNFGVRERGGKIMIVAQAQWHKQDANSSFIISVIIMVWRFRQSCQIIRRFIIFRIRAQSKD